uniref:Uncharacterized protein n=1 Tax=Lactuca sativa TaxID=4236 RepID=A0A9R1WRL4_LACSA|nr:hypothetical protein LSAT_V11C100039530 [Lactuca sativa]
MDVCGDENFNNLKGIANLAKMMVKAKNTIYLMVYLLLKLTLILPIPTSTATHSLFSNLGIQFYGFNGTVAKGNDSTNTDKIAIISKRYSVRMEQYIRFRHY